MSNSPTRRASPLTSILNGLTGSDFDVIGQVELPARDARHAAPPATLNPALLATLTVQYPNGLYAH